ncbi:MAG: nucleotidyltransferase domain-containing protein [Gammaproteobacteria bacterium]|nr:nucleotidyltransferase domain-containing protein [Gammaproteobacteria bacterium]
MNSFLQISENDLKIIKTILMKHLPDGVVVWVFGSRAKVDPVRRFSDLDLAIDAQQALSLEISSALAHDFDESNLPYKVDIIDWVTISPSFRKNIEDSRIEIFKK